MSDEQEIQVSEADLSRAKGMGWVEKENFRGDPARWTDAATFLKRGDEFMPILRANNKRLEETVGLTKQQLDAQTKAFQELQGSVQQLQTFYAENAKQQAARIRKELMEELKQARKDDDVEAEVEIQGKLTKLDQPAHTPAPKAEAPASQHQQVDPSQNPEYLQFVKENPWFTQDKILAGAALAIGDTLVAETRGQLRGKAFFDEVAKQMRERFPEHTGARERGASKVEGSRGSSGGGSGGGGGNSYADLPAEAKAVCKQEADKFVGPNKAFKDLGAWQAEYAKIYFGS